MTERLNMMRPPPTADRPKNLLLARLPPEDFCRIQPHLTTIRTTTRQMFLKQGEAIERVLFLNGGVASVTLGTAKGQLIEVATVGDEGFVGVAALFHNRGVNAGETMMQIPDTDAETMPVEAFRTEMERRGALHEAVGRYAEGFVALALQSTLCIAVHPVQDRLCRWLLMAHDRVRRDEFELSHEFLATMLGSTRPTVTIVAGSLQQAGVIRYRHGRMTILDRTALENGACECYAMVRNEFVRLDLV